MKSNTLLLGNKGKTVTSHSLTRRHILFAGIAPVALSLAACSKPSAPVFQGVDLTGADYAKDFRLTDTEGRERSVADFKGKLVVLFFGFTQCPDVCPTALTRAVAIKELLGSDGQRMQVLFATVDPERDKPVVLKAYVQAFEPSFMGLYSTMEHTREVADAFKVYYKKVPTGSSYTMDHSTLSYVFDPAGRLRLALRHSQTAQECVSDLRQLM